MIYKITFKNHLFSLFCQQVVIFQTYTNNSIVPIEAKYVFPLEETAAVCGFEAFINGKHVIGKVAFPSLHFCFCFSNLQYSFWYILFLSPICLSFS